MLSRSEERIYDAIKDFPWHDYGLDSVEECLSNEWAVDLTKLISSYFGSLFNDD